MNSVQRRLSPVEQRAFIDEVIAINLRRVGWFYGVVLGINGFLAALGYALSSSLLLIPIRTYIVDWVTGGLFMACAYGLRRSGVSQRVRSGFVWFFIAWQVGIGIYYYFSLLGEVGPTTIYVVSVVMMGALFLAEPRKFAALLLTCHALYCILLIRANLALEALVPTLIDNSVAVVLAVIAQTFIYSLRRREFQQRQELEAQTLEMNEIMMFAAHDLRSPLQSLANVYGVAQGREEWQRDPYRSLLKQSLHVFSDLLELINRLLSSHAAGQTDSPASTNIHEVLQACQKMASPLAEAKDMRLSFPPKGQPAWASVHSEPLRQVIENLLANAIKFSPPGSRVSVRLEKGSDEWRIEVADEGVGIPEEERATLFQKFRRGSLQPTADEPTSGLGLFIARTLLHSMGGTLEFEPRVPTGSVFRLRIPAEV